jgi:CBS domain-containing protein
VFVKNMMIPNHACVTVQEDTTLGAALEQLETNQIDGVPVLQG